MSFETQEQQERPKLKRESNLPREAMVWVRESDLGVEEEVSEQEGGYEEEEEEDTFKVGDDNEEQVVVAAAAVASGKQRLSQRLFRSLRGGGSANNSANTSPASSNPGSDDEDNVVAAEAKNERREHRRLLRGLGATTTTTTAAAKWEEKEIVFVRHGQSLGQLASKRDRKTLASLVDANLSDRGVQQATALSALLGHHHQSDENDDDMLVVCSPLTRAIRTAGLLFPQPHVRILVHPGFAELNNAGSNGIPENTGRALAELLEDDTVAALLKQERVDYSRIASPAVWPPSSSSSPPSAEEVEEDNVRLMIEFLMTRPEKRICVVTHHHFIYSLFPSHFLPKLRQHSHKAPTRVRNCFPIHTIVTTKPSIRVAAGPHAWWTTGST